MVLCVGPTSDDNLRMFAIDCCSTISIQAASSTVSFFDLSLSSGLVSSFLKCYVKRSSTASGPSISFIYFAAALVLLSTGSMK